MKDNRRDSYKNILVILVIQGLISLLLTIMILREAGVLSPGRGDWRFQLFRNTLPGLPMDSGSGNSDSETFQEGVLKEKDSVYEEIDKTATWLRKVNIPEDAITFNGHSYYLFDNIFRDWDDVLAYCESRGGYPAVVEDEDENEMLYQYMLSTNRKTTFIGYTDRETEGIWRWVEGHSSDFTDWGINDEGVVEPNATSREEDYAQLDANMNNGHWNDCAFGHNATSYICEWDTIKK